MAPAVPLIWWASAVKKLCNQMGNFVILAGIRGGNHTSTKQSIQHGGQVGLIDGLVQHPVTTGIKQSIGFLLITSRKGNHRSPEPGLAQQPGCSDPIHPGHVTVHQNQMNGIGQRRPDRFVASGNRQHIQTRAA